MRKVFFSFHYENDNWRVQQIKNMGIIEGQKICNSNEWEQVKRCGDSSIKKWIDNNMHGCSCVVVLIGSQTASRKWVKYEIKKAWEDGKTLLGIYIHRLKDSNGNFDQKGENPFDNLKIKSSGIPLSSFVDIKEPNFYDAYSDIKNNLSKWIEDAIDNRKN